MHQLDTATPGEFFRDDGDVSILLVNRGQGTPTPGESGSGGGILHQIRPFTTRHPMMLMYLDYFGRALIQGEAYESPPR